MRELELKRTWDDWHRVRYYLGLICDGSALVLMSVITLYLYVNIVILCRQDSELRQRLVENFFLDEPMVGFIDWPFMEMFKTFFELNTAGWLMIVIIIIMVVYGFKTLRAVMRAIIDRLAAMIFHHNVFKGMEKATCAKYYAINCSDQELRMAIMKQDIGELFCCILGIRLTFAQVNDFYRHIRTTKRCYFEIPKFLVYQEKVACAKITVSRIFLERLRSKMAVGDTVVLLSLVMVDISMREWEEDYDGDCPEIYEF